MNWAVTVDAKGLCCPVPIIELAKAMRQLPAGARVLLLATDPAAASDVRAWCEATGHRLVSLETGAGGACQAVVEKAEG
jgi:tRNA 2-thiouridine synthesizing protein A